MENISSVPIKCPMLVLITVIHGKTWLLGGGDCAGAFISTDGRYMVTMAGQTLHISSDYGKTWITKLFPGSPSSVRAYFAMSADGRYMVITMNQEYIYVSSDYGMTWTKIEGTHNYRSAGIARMSPDGKCMSVCIGQKGVFVSVDYGVNWKLAISAMKYWTSFAMSSDGRYMVAKSSSMYKVIITSSDYGNTWKESESTWYCSDLEMSRDGKYVLGYYLGGLDSRVFVSSDYGNTWKEVLIGLVKSLTDCAMSSDGRYMTAVLGRYNEFAYMSSDYGNTWQAYSFGARTGTYRIAMNI